MQLVYVWLGENYKGIGKNQGFNLSNKYLVNFKDNVLNIEYKKNYIKNFYNISESKSVDLIELIALVGENGSGKTTILSYLFEDLSNEELRTRLLDIIVFRTDAKELCELEKNKKIKTGNIEHIKQNECEEIFIVYTNIDLQLKASFPAIYRNDIKSGLLTVDQRTQLRDLKNENLLGSYNLIKQFDIVKFSNVVDFNHEYGEDFDEFDYSGGKNTFNISSNYIFQNEKNYYKVKAIVISMYMELFSNAECEQWVKKFNEYLSIPKYLQINLVDDKNSYTYLELQKIYSELKKDEKVEILNANGIQYESQNLDTSYENSVNDKMVEEILIRIFATDDNIGFKAIFELLFMYIYYILEKEIQKIEIKENIMFESLKINIVKFLDPDPLSYNTFDRQKDKIEEIYAYVLGYLEDSGEPQSNIEIKSNLINLVKSVGTDELSEDNINEHLKIIISECEILLDKAYIGNKIKVVTKDFLSKLKEEYKKINFIHIHGPVTLDLEELMKKYKQSLDEIFLEKDNHLTELYDYYKEDTVFENGFVEHILSIINVFSDKRLTKDKNIQINLSLLNDEKKVQSFLKVYERLEYIQPKLLFVWENLSSGEVAIYNILSRMYSFLKNNRIFLRRGHKDNLILLMDEIDINLHPNWQMKLIEILIGFINDFFDYKNIQIIITTHSPLVLSDISKENVIFLKKSENGNCVLEEEIEIKETFAANINSLLSSAFFMNDGLIGSFANLKISEIIEHIRKEKVCFKDNEDLLRNIRIIGEPLIKIKLQEMYDKENPSTVDDLKKRISDLEKELEKAQKGGDENDKN